MSIATIPVARHHKGFTLLEVLVALVIFSIGLLGIAGLEAQGLRYNHSAYLRTQATFQAYDILDRMRANRDAAASNGYNAEFNTPGTDNGCNSAAVTCTTTQMAQFDIFEWKANLLTLPNGVGSVTKAGDIYTVIVQWDDPGTPGGASSISIGSEL